MPRRNTHPPPSLTDNLPSILESYQFFLRYTRPYRFLFMLAFFGLAVTSGLSLAFPYLFGRLVDVVFRHQNIDRLNSFLYVLVIILVVQIIFNVGRSYCLHYISEKIVTDIRKDLYAHVLRLSINFFANRRVGEIASRLNADVTSIQATITSNLVDAVRQIAWGIGGVTAMALLNLKMTLLTLTVLPFLVIAAMLVGRVVRSRSLRVQDHLAKANAVLKESFSGIRTVQAFNREPFEFTRYTAYIEGAHHEALSRAKARSIFTAFAEITLFGGILLMLWFSVDEIKSNRLTAGQLMSFLLYATGVNAAIGAGAGLYLAAQQALGASQRVIELFKTQPEVIDDPKAVPLTNVEGNVEFHNVSFSYPGHEEKRVLDGVSITANPGEVIALVGLTGAGKSTIISLIPRFYDVTQGKITLDGQDIRHIPLIDLREQIAIVPQDAVLFHSTVMENIIYGRVDATEAEVETAARAAHAHEFIQALPNGYQTVIGERGIKLSGGQRQRLSIARALLKDPKILILDEATSSLDSESERLVQDALDQLMRNRTSFVIAHRLGTIRQATRILVLDEGKIVEEGTHEELLAADGLYKKLYSLQFRDIQSADPAVAVSEFEFEEEPVETEE